MMGVLFPGGEADGVGVVDGEDAWDEEDEEDRGEE